MCGEVAREVEAVGKREGGAGSMGGVEEEEEEERKEKKIQTKPSSSPFPTQPLAT